MVFLEYCRVVVVALEMAIPKKTLKDKWTTYVHVWHKVVLFIGVDEERSNGEANEDQSADDGDHPNGNLLGDESPADDGKAGADEMAENAPDAHARHIVDTFEGQK